MKFEKTLRAIPHRVGCFIALLRSKSARLRAHARAHPAEPASE